MTDTTDLMGIVKQGNALEEWTDIVVRKKERWRMYIFPQYRATFPQSMEYNWGKPYFRNPLRVCAYDIEHCVFIGLNWL